MRRRLTRAATLPAMTYTTERLTSHEGWLQKAQNGSERPRGNTRPRKRLNWRAKEGPNAVFSGPPR